MNSLGLTIDQIKELQDKGETIVYLHIYPQPDLVGFQKIRHIVGNVWGKSTTYAGVTITHSKDTITCPYMVGKEISIFKNDCINENCNSRGVIAIYDYENDELYPEQCQYCYENLITATVSDIDVIHKDGWKFELTIKNRGSL